MFTHVLAGLVTWDDLVVLDAGRVVVRGTHAELLRGGGPYAESWVGA
jgi:ABC-type transport system involved in Fe-S cluster assembly fused permease/ATPase subunit